MDMLSLINDCTDAKALRSLLKNPLFSEVVPHIEARIAVVAPKPSWKPPLKFTKRGGFVCPEAVYLDGVDALIETLKEYKAHPDAKPFPRG